MYPVTTYTLRLVQDKYYVERTEGPMEKRYVDHAGGRGAEWTRMYPPLSILSTQESTDPFDETRVTLEAMKRFGIDNVRGGPFCRATIDEATREVIIGLIDSIDGRCFNCHRLGHTTSACRATPDSPGAGLLRHLPSPPPPPVPVPSGMGSLFDIPRAIFAMAAEDVANLMNKAGFAPIAPASPPSPPPRPSRKRAREEASEDECARCGRSSHETHGCYATRHENGDLIEDDDEDDEEEQRVSHRPAKRAYYFQNNGCLRCGRIGHRVDRCHARTHFNGRVLDDDN